MTPYFFTDFLLASFARIMLDFLKGRKGFSMRFYISVLLCVLVCPITVAFAESENVSSSSYYYDVNNVCTNKLWCSNNPDGGCCSQSNFKPIAKKDGYTLRGWTTSLLDDVEENTPGFISGKVNINASGNVTGNILTGTAFYPAWARNCVNSDYCRLTIGNDGSVTYSVQNCTEPTRSGYNFGCENPSLNTTEQWINITLDDGNPGTISNPDRFYCQINSNIRNCYGCFIEKECHSEKFTKLTIMPVRDTYEYVGHYYNNSEIIDKNGFLTSNWQQIQSEDVSIVARWQQEQITVHYNYASCNPSSSCNSTATCNVGGTFVLPSNPSNGCVGDGYEFNSWTVGSRAYTTTAQNFTCDENLGTVVANCSSTGENVGDEIVIKGFYIQ